MDGWIKLHRKITDSAVFDNPKVLKVWIWCLTKASHKEHDILVGMTPVHLMPGQFVYGRHAAAKELGMPASTVRNCMNILEKLKNVDIKADSLFSVITIENWAFYQGEDKNKDSKEDKERTRKGHKQEWKEGKEIKPGGKAYKPFEKEEWELDHDYGIDTPDYIKQKLYGGKSDD